MMLLFVVIYIYSYIAFNVLRDSYLNIDHSSEDAPE